MLLSGKLLKLQQHLKTLPGIGEKTAQRLALFIISQSKDKSRAFSQSILDAIEVYDYCPQCNCLTDTFPCNLCSDTSRDHQLLCIVEQSRDVYHIESTKEYKGYYFVLGHLLSPIDGIGPDEIKLNQLLDLIKAKDFKEVIFAISPSTEGETTIHFIAEFLKDQDICLTRLSTGIPYGSDMEYTGTITLLNALKRRFPI